MKAVLVALLVLLTGFTFNLTQNMTEEGRILDLCINLDAYIPNCEMIYGGKDYGNVQTASGETCEDIAGVEKWNSEGHGDNNPSEKEFIADMNEQTFCEFAEDIDHMEKEGAIREDTKHDWDWFEDTIVYQSAGEETQEKLKDLYDLPDDGKKNLEAYEFLEAIY